MFGIIIVAIVSLPIWLLPFGPIVWTLLLIGSLINYSSRKSARVAHTIADRQSKEMRTMLRVTNPEAAVALEAEERATAKREKDASNTRGIIAIAVGLALLFIFGIVGYYQ